MFKDKVIWITGASSGIGRALAHAFAREGADLVLSARNLRALEETASGVRGLGGRAEVLPLDAEVPEVLPEKALEAGKIFGRIDVLVNNAGVSHRNLFLETDYAVIDRLLKVNLLSQLILARAVLPEMVSRGRGLIVGVSSLVGKFGSPLRTVYSAAKHGLHGFYDSLRAEVGKQGVGVAVVIPGFVRTDISRHALAGDGIAREIMDRNQELGISPEMCAIEILRGLRAGRDEIYCGMNGKARLGLFLARWFPSVIRKNIGRVKVT